MTAWMLPPFEMACLRWVARGKTLAEIAVLEGKSVTEIELCLERAAGMLGAKSVEEAIVKADASHTDRH